MDRQPNSRARALSWDWSEASLGAACTLPAAAIALGDPRRGIAMAIGVLPAAIIGLAPTRRARAGTAVGGLLIAVPLFLGGVLAGVPVLAVAVIALLGPATALLATRSRVGQLTMVLSLPMLGIGLSYSDVGQAAGLAALMVAGSLFAAALSMAWPERAAPVQPRGEPPTLAYGLRLGAAGASAAAIGFLLNLEHVGWACAAALLVMRPSAEMQRLRSVGRVLAVAVGALLAVELVRLEPAGGWYAAAAIVAVAGAAGTHRSRWYVTPGFTTFLVFVLLLYSDPQSAGSRFFERTGETALGVGLAYLFGLGLPALARRRRLGGLRGSD